MSSKLGARYVLPFLALGLATPRARGLPEVGARGHLHHRPVRDVADRHQHRRGRARHQPGLSQRGPRPQALEAQDDDQDHHSRLPPLRLHGLPALPRHRLARHRGRGDADGDPGGGRVPVAGVQQPRLLPHHPLRHHHRSDRVRPRPAHGSRRGPLQDDMSHYLEVRGLEKTYRAATGTVRVLGGVDLSLEDGEFVAIVGYSGSGKTTLVSLIAGLVAPDAGTIVLDGAPVTEPGPERGIVFQQYSLLPWMSVYDNVALAVDAVNPGVAGPERRRLTEEFIALVNLSEATWKRPRELSGGMRQRVAVARGLAMRPKLLLMDEPFSALDALTRATLQDELLRIWGERRSTVIMVTNDVDEAILLADRIYPMTPGPDAVLGPAIEVGLPRPRQRRHMSLEPAYQKARRALVEFLRGRSRLASTAGHPREP